MKNRDEIRSVRISSFCTFASRSIRLAYTTLTTRYCVRQLIELHGPEPQTHYIRRLILAAGSVLSPSSPQPPPVSTPSQPTPPTSLVVRLLADQVQRMSRDPSKAEKFKDAVLQGSEGPGGSDSVLAIFSLPTLLDHPSLTELSPLERVVFCTPFLTLLYTSSPGFAASTGLKRALGLDAARLIRRNLPTALEQLSSPATSSSDLADLSPLPISKLFSILLSHMTMGEIEGEGEEVFTEEERRAIILAAVRGRLGAEVGSQALAHALGEMSFDVASPPTAIAALSRLSPVGALCSPDLVRAVLLRFGNLGPTNPSDGAGGVELRVAAMLFDLIDLAMQDAESAGSIDLASWVRGVHDLQPALRWGDVVRAFDNPSRALPEVWGLRLFASFLPLSPSPPDSTSSAIATSLTLYSSPGGTSAISGLWFPWTNPHLQFGLIERLVYLPTESFNLAALPSLHRVVSLDDAARASPTIKNLAIAVQGSTWNCRELIATLIHLSEAGVGTDLSGRVEELLDRACKTNPELILIALVAIEVGRSLHYLRLRHALIHCL
jgi:CCR4-NOT transcription complex subunit 1